MYLSQDERGPERLGMRLIGQFRVVSTSEIKQSATKTVLHDSKGPGFTGQLQLRTE